MTAKTGVVNNTMGPTLSVTTTLPREMYQRIDRLAKERNTSKSELLRELIIERVGRGAAGERGDA